MSPTSQQTIIVVEGPHDIRFLTNLSSILHVADPLVPDLATLERQGEIIFLSSGGVCSPAQARQLTRLDRPQFHLLDRDVPPETSHRQQTVRAINALPGCVARMTEKRSLENYLHFQAILEARGIHLSFEDQDDVATLAARAILQDRQPEMDWEELTHRAKKRMRNRAKKWLNHEAAIRMTPQRLQLTDPNNEVLGWLTMIAELTQMS